MSDLLDELRRGGACMRVPYVPGQACIEGWPEVSYYRDDIFHATDAWDYGFHWGRVCERKAQAWAGAIGGTLGSWEAPRPPVWRPRVGDRVKCNDGLKWVVVRVGGHLQWPISLLGDDGTRGLAAVHELRLA